MYKNMEKMDVNLYWIKNGVREYVLSIKFHELDKFMGLIDSIVFEREGKLVADVFDGDERIEKLIDLDGLFNVRIEHKQEDSEHEYFDYTRFFPEENQSSTMK